MKNDIPFLGTGGINPYTLRALGFSVSTPKLFGQNHKSNQRNKRNMKAHHYFIAAKVTLCVLVVVLFYSAVFVVGKFWMFISIGMTILYVILLLLAVKNCN